MNLCTKDEVSDQLKCSKRTIDNWVASGTMPKPIHLGRRALWTQYVESYGLGVEKIMNFSGHKDPRTIHDHYLKPQSQTIVAEISALDNAKQGVDFLGFARTIYL